MCHVTQAMLGGPEIIALVIRPIGVPPAIGGPRHVESLPRRAPETLVGAEPVEMIAGELPRDLELSTQVLASGHARHLLNELPW